jgi:hypothetical protein
VESDGSLLLMDKFGWVLRAVPEPRNVHGMEHALNQTTYRVQRLVRLGLGRPLAFKKHPITGHLIACVAGMVSRPFFVLVCSWLLLL